MALFKRKFLKSSTHIFLVLSLGFVIWMLFFDANSYLIHRELNAEIEDLEAEKAYYQNEIIKDKKAIKELQSDLGVEKLAREKYYMKKSNEDIFIIEYEDSIPKEK
ncbi:septum formation initiator family protein [Bizionia sediminis]|uniref:Septum formation initiator family protein n=1 Tax=Bizionia sediminis TaxID=1737064 RepID=A0ABW5KQ10_9FLAO